MSSPYLVVLVEVRPVAEDTVFRTVGHSAHQLVRQRQQDNIWTSAPSGSAVTYPALFAVQRAVAAQGAVSPPRAAVEQHTQLEVAQLDIALW